MKIAVYAIAKNEAKHVERWEACSRDADYRAILDTGSTDNTLELAQKLGINVKRKTFYPWRFDRARNFALSMIPEDIDYCINLDLDEVLHEGWREAFNKLDPAIVTRPRYKYVFSRNPDGSEGFTYWGHSIHHRHGYEWRGAIHEYVTRKDGESPDTQQYCDFTVEHLPDATKPRSQYLDLLKEAARTHPESDRYAFYYGRELYYRGKHADAAVELKRHLALESSTWAAERASSMRYLAVCEPDQAESWLLHACAEAPGRREAWVDLAMLHYRREDWASCWFAACRALRITEKPMEYFCEAEAWGLAPHDLAALSAYHLGLFDEALRHGEAALEFAPDDSRLLENVDWYRKRASDSVMLLVD